MIPESFIQELISRVDIVDVIDKWVPLKKAGANYSACCPFHKEKSPSFTVSPVKQFYHCFGCGAHGTAIGFVMEYQGLSFIEAVHELAKLAGMIVPQETKPAETGQNTNQPSRKAHSPDMHEALQAASRYYRHQLRQSQRAIQYLKQRGLSGEIAAQFQIGYAPAEWQNLANVFPDYEAEVLTEVGLVIENEQGRRYDRFRDRIMFPIHNQKGQIIGFGGRVIESSADNPKYLNSPETPLFQKGYELYGLFLARRAIREAEVALVVEGYMDVVALAQFGIGYAVAALGTATTPAHISKLMRQSEHIVFCFDGDAAGQKAAWRAAMNALPALTDQLRLSFLFLPETHDPDSYIREYGKAGFEQALQTALPLSQYLLQQLTKENPLRSQEDRVKLLNACEPILKEIRAQKLSLLLRKEIAQKTGISEDEIKAILKLPDTPRKKWQPERIKRTTVSLRLRWISMILERPALVLAEDLQWFKQYSPDDQLLLQVLEIALTNPDSHYAGLITLLQNKLTDNEIAQLPDGWLLEEDIDAALEFDGARKQMMEQSLLRHQSGMLQQLQAKPLSDLSAEERKMLNSLLQRK